MNPLAFKATYNYMMVKNVDICIRGAGIVGCATALALSRLRLKVALIYKAPNSQISLNNPNSTDPRAYALNAQSRAFLQNLKVWPIGNDCTPTQIMKVYSDEGTLVEFKAPQTNNKPTPLNWIVDVRALESSLKKALDESSVEQLHKSTESEEHLQAQLNIFCEGVNGFSRGLSQFGLSPQRTKYSYGQHALATQVQIDQPHLGTAYQWFNTTSSTKVDNYVGKTSFSTDLAQINSLEIVALLPTRGELGNTFALVWSAPTVKIQRLLDLEQQNSQEFKNIFINALSDATHHIFKNIQPTAELKAWPLSYSSVRHWVGAFNARSSWALCGDNAHTVHPLAGMGLNIGLADIQTLYNLLSERQQSTPWRPLNDLRLLRAYERHRKLDLLPTTKVIDGVQRLFDSPYPLAKFVRNQGFKVFNQLNPLKEWTIRQAMR
jgi:ubiquinone biosynthesis UbiH/UbiF/VisC/COQ6 family hydroxylase